MEIPDTVKVDCGRCSNGVAPGSRSKECKYCEGTGYINKEPFQAIVDLLSDIEARLDSIGDDVRQIG